MHLPKPTPADDLTGPQLAQPLTQLGYTKAVRFPPISSCVRAAA